ncbi:MAG TPA: nuclear transport factor 2 family protein [Acidimicrobiia bacterium]|jgi:hypothetical protein
MRTPRTLLVAATLVTVGLVGGGITVASGQNENDAASGRALPVGAEFIQALADRDFPTARAMLAPEVEFKALTPSQGFLDLTGPEAVMSLMQEWYGTAEAIESLETNRVLQRHHVGYRIRWQSPEDGPMVFEQQAYYDVDDSGRIRRLHLVCSGDQPVSS